MATSGPTTAGQPYRLKIGGSRWVSPTISFNNQKSTFNIHQSAILPPTTPMATSGRTAAGQPYPFKSSAPHPAEPELPSARAELRALRSAELRPWSLPFAPLSPVPPEVEPYLPFFCSKSSSYFRVRSRVSRFHFFLTPMATSGRTAAGQPYQFLSDVINQISEFMPPRGH